MSDLIDLSAYNTTDESGDTVLKPFTEVKTAEDCYQCVVHNKGTGPVIDLFLTMYQEGLRQEWYTQASEYNETLTEVQEWNANKPESKDENDEVIIPDDRPEPEAPTPPEILAVDEYKVKNAPFLEAAANDNKRSRMYGSYAALGSWNAVCRDFGYPDIESS